VNGDMCVSFKPKVTVDYDDDTNIFLIYVFILLQAAQIVKKVYSVLPDYDKIVAALLKDGVWELPKKCDFTPGVPVGPMLSKATKGVSEILNKFQDVEFTCEYKYDGERAQVMLHGHIFHLKCTDYDTYYVQ
jgi:ATP-dependent DNA ligase